MLTREQIEQLAEQLPDDERAKLAAHLSELAANSAAPRSTANSLLKYAGSWAGDDLEECLELVYKTRSETKF